MEIKTITINTLDYYELDQAVSRVYGHGWSFVSDWEAHNEACYRFNGIDGLPLHLYDQNKLEEFKAGRVTFFLTPSLLNDLVTRGEIPAGDYLIIVSW
jgi:hypothetical protein